MSLTAVENFRVPADLIAATELQLCEAGEQVAERFVLWSGRQQDQIFTVEAMHVPEQTAYRHEGGLLVRVEGPALHRLNDWLHDYKHRLAGQVHAHPDSAYHSETDDTFPIVTALGGLSLVAAEFCGRGLLASDSAAFRLTRQGWQPSEIPLTRLIEII
jgi:hypothetical protein